MDLLLLTPHMRKLLNQSLLIMKLTAVFLLAAMVQVSAKGTAQTVTYRAESQPLETLFQVIEKQTGYTAVYRKDDLLHSHSVTASWKNVELKAVLDELVRDQSLQYDIRGTTIVFSKKATERTFPFPNGNAPPPVEIHGRVIDSVGNPLNGATIQLNGSKRIVLTDKDGQFVMSNVPDDATIFVSFIGYNQQKIRIAGRTDFVIRLDPVAAQLENVEITLNNGYQKIPKERATGSFDFIDNKKFNEQVSTNVLDRLEGIANGLNIDRRGINTGEGNTGITIRGVSTIRGQKDPLIIVDNFPYDGDINNINPNNVESITILKDAAASSLWGARAGNGVIVITTKQGRFGQKMKVDVNANVSITDKPDLSAISQISSADFIDFEKLLFSNGYYDSQEQDIYSRPALSPVVELLIKARDHLITQKDADDQIEVMKKYDLRNDYNKYIYRKGVHQQYSMDVNGGTNTVAYHLSAGYDNDISNLHAVSHRINLSSLNTFRPVKNLEISAGMYFTQNNGKNGNTGYGGTGGFGYAQFPIYTRLVDDQGNPVPVYRYRQPFIDTLGNGQLLDWKYYPLDDYKHATIDQDPIDLTLKTSVAYRLMPGLRISFNYQYERQKVTTTTTNDLESYYTRDMINKFTQLPQDGLPAVYPLPKGSIQTTEESNLVSNQFRGQLDYIKSWGRNAITALAGGEVRSAVLNSSGNMVYGLDPNTSSLTIVDYITPFPNLISHFGQQIPYSPYVSKTDSRFISAYANGAYTYADKYTLSGSMRKDGANIFGTTTNNKWKPLWSAGLSWDIAKENFYRWSALPYLKLRTTYGYSGNVTNSVVGVATISYYPFNNPFLGTPQSVFTSYNNPSLRWENVGQTNIGIDFATRKNIVAGSIEYYRKKCTDLIGPSAVDYTNLPVSYLTMNVGSISSQGVDIQLLTKNIDRKIKWSTNWNFSWNKDRVISYYAGDTTLAEIVGNSSLSHGGNKAIHGVYSYKWAGLDPHTGAPLGFLNGHISSDYNAVGQTSYENAVYHGSANPVFFGFIDNIISWKHISLTVNIIYKAGYYFRRTSIGYSDLAYQGSGSADYAKRWQKPGDELHTHVPALVYPFNGDSQTFYERSSVLVDKGDNIRLNYVRLNYDVPQQWLNRIGLNTLNFYVNAQNLGIIWKANKDGLDPDYQTSFQSLKPSRIVSVGLTTSF